MIGSGGTIQGPMVSEHVRGMIAPCRAVPVIKHPLSTPCRWGIEGPPGEIDGTGMG